FFAQECVDSAVGGFAIVAARKKVIKWQVKGLGRSVVYGDHEPINYLTEARRSYRPLPRNRTSPRSRSRCICCRNFSRMCLLSGKRLSANGAHTLQTSSIVKI